MSDLTGYYGAGELYLDTSLVTKRPVPIDAAAAPGREIPNTEIVLLGGDWTAEDDEYGFNYASPGGY